MHQPHPALASGVSNKGAVEGSGITLEAGLISPTSLGGLSLPWQRPALLWRPEVRTVSAVLCCEACCGIRVWALLSRALSCLAEHPSRTPGQVSLTECGSPKGLQNNMHPRVPPSEVFSISLGWDWESVFFQIPGWLGSL